jgi:hypothetical protein
MHLLATRLMQFWGSLQGVVDKMAEATPPGEKLVEQGQSALSVASGQLVPRAVVLAASWVVSSVEVDMSMVEAPS